jgi:hypothetical protein
MDAEAAGLLLVGAALGALAMRGLAWTAAKARVLDLEARHQGDLDRLAIVQQMREEAIRRGVGPDAADVEQNLFQQLRATHLARRAGVLPIRKARE